MTQFVKKAGFIILFLFSMNLLTVVYASEDLTEISVSVTGEHDFRSIQKAVDMVKPGGTIRVHNGTYFENLYIWKTVTIIGEDNRGTIIDGKQKGDSISIFADNCIIKGFTITNCSGNESNAGITVQSDNTVISDNIISNNSGRGIYLYGAKNTIITNNVFRNNGLTIIGGTDVLNWNTHVIKNNTVNNKKIYYYKNKNNYVFSGPDIGEIILANCTNCVVKNTDISNVDEGIILGYSNNCSLINNSVSHTKIGLFLSYSNYNIIQGNNVSKNNYGIQITHSNNNKVLSNMIYKNKKCGCRICCNSNYNTMYLNSFMFNNQSASDYFRNQWYNKKIGNKWSDYNGLDENNDGIGDTPYLIPDGENKDPFPIVGSLKKFRETNDKKTPAPSLLISITMLILTGFIRKKRKRKEEKKR